MNRLITTLFAITVFAFAAYGQDEPDKICISRAAAESCATNAATVKALESEIAVLRQALADKDTIINDLKVEVALRTGRITALEQNDASNRAIITAMIPMLRVKKFGLINLF